MALLTHSGTSGADLSVAGTKRDDISEILAASLVMSPETAGMLTVGPEFVDNICKWTEDKLNPDVVTDTTAGGITAAGTTLTLSLADAATLDIGAILVDTSSSTSGMGGEMLQVTAITGQTITVVRGYAGTTAVAHAQNAVYSVVARPTYEGSDLGRDMSRARVPKYNYIHRHEANVNLSSEVIQRSRKGYTPGIGDELEYQFFQRLQELIRLWDKTILYSPPSPGQGGGVGSVGGDYSSMCGFRKFLDGTFNTTAAPVNYSGAGYVSGQADSALNSLNKTLFRNGALPDWCLGGANIAEAVGRLYTDRIRIQQDEFTRGFAAHYFRTTLSNELRLLLDGFVYDTAGAAEIFVIDSSRVRLRPFSEQWLFVLTAPTMRDGDAVRVLSKMSMEFRNTGTDTGAASGLIYNVTA